MILVDTGPLVALFDPKEAEHFRCRAVLRTLTEPLVTPPRAVRARRASRIYL